MPSVSKTRYTACLQLLKILWLSKFPESDHQILSVCARDRLPDDQDFQVVNKMFIPTRITLQSPRCASAIRMPDVILPTARANRSTARGKLGNMKFLGEVKRKRPTCPCGRFGHAFEFQRRKQTRTRAGARSRFTYVTNCRTQPPLGETAMRFNVPAMPCTLLSYTIKRSSEDGGLPLTLQ
jgi:hypothetical protein